MVHPNQAAFAEGLGYILKSWTAMKLAVEQEWGGHDSIEKRDWMAETLVEYFGASKFSLLPMVFYVTIDH
jgi:pre-rRNA-processing protein TSR2